MEPCTDLDFCRDLNPRGGNIRTVQPPKQMVAGIPDVSVGMGPSVPELHGSSSNSDRVGGRVGVWGAFWATIQRQWQEQQVQEQGQQDEGQEQQVEEKDSQRNLHGATMLDTIDSIPVEMSKVAFKEGIDQILNVK